MAGLPPDPNRNEVHVCLAPNGHRLSVDCWCEPRNIQWHTNAHGIKILVVEHIDTEPPILHHSGVIHARDIAQDWVTSLLDTIETGEPHDPHERKLS